MDRDRIITLTEAAREFSLPALWLREHVDNDKFPHLSIGRKVYFSRNALEAALLEMAGAPSPTGAPP